MDAHDWLRASQRQSDLTSKARLAVAVLFAHMDRDGSSCHPSTSTIAAEMGLKSTDPLYSNGKGSVGALDELEQKGWVLRVRRQGAANRNETTAYFATIPIDPDPPVDQPVETPAEPYRQPSTGSSYRQPVTGRSGGAYPAGPGRGYPAARGRGYPAARGRTLPLTLPLTLPEEPEHVQRPTSGPSDPPSEDPGSMMDAILDRFVDDVKGGALYLLDAGYDPGEVRGAVLARKKKDPDVWIGDALIVVREAGEVAR